jgi:hypothetical protein
MAYLGMRRAHRHGLGNLLIHNDIYMHSLLCLTLQELVKSVLWELGRGAAEVDFGSEPPVLCTESSFISTV